MEPYYIVLEYQLNNGASAILPYAFDNKTAALSKYFTILASAVQSSIDMHGAFMISTDDDRIMKCEVIDRRPEPVD